jgi:hypothetical protein
MNRSPVFRAAGLLGYKDLRNVTQPKIITQSLFGCQLCSHLVDACALFHVEQRLIRLAYV